MKKIFFWFSEQQAKNLRDIYWNGSDNPALGIALAVDLESGQIFQYTKESETEADRPVYEDTKDVGCFDERNVVYLRSIQNNNGYLQYRISETDGVQQPGLSDARVERYRPCATDNPAVAAPRSTLDTPAAGSPGTLLPPEPLLAASRQALPFF